VRLDPEAFYRTMIPIVVALGLMPTRTPFYLACSLRSQQSARVSRPRRTAILERWRRRGNFPFGISATGEVTHVGPAEAQGNSV